MLPQGCMWLRSTSRPRHVANAKKPGVGEDILCGSAEMSDHRGRARELSWIWKDGGEAPRWSLMSSRQLKTWNTSTYTARLTEASPGIQTPNKWLLREKEVRARLWSHHLHSHLHLSWNPQRNQSLSLEFSGGNWVRVRPNGASTPPERSLIKAYILQEGGVL